MGMTLRGPMGCRGCQAKPEHKCEDVGEQEYESAVVLLCPIHGCLMSNLTAPYPLPHFCLNPVLLDAAKLGGKGAEGATNIESEKLLLGPVAVLICWARQPWHELQFGIAMPQQNAVPPAWSCHRF